MIRSIIFEDTIKLFWEYSSLVTQGGYYLIDGAGKQIKTDKTHADFFGLTPNTEYVFLVRLYTKDGILAQNIGDLTVRTINEKRKIDVSKAPYNAIGDGNFLNTQALQNAIDDCKTGECVFIPDGVFLTGAITLHSGVELRLSKGTILQGTENPSDYLPKVWSRFEGIEMECYASLINIGKLDYKKGYTTENVVVRGGSVCGGGEMLRKNMISQAEKDFAESVLSVRRRGKLISVHNAQNVVISDVNAGNSPAWNIHIVYSDNVITCGGEIFSHGISNGDGWDPDSSTNCTLFDIDFDTGDDCVAIKSGKNPEGNIINRPCEHIRVFDCRSKGGNGIAIGSEMSGGISDIKIWDCDMQTSFAGINIKSTIERGGYIKDVEVCRCKTSKILFRNFMNGNNDGEASISIPRLENFIFEDITISGVETYTDNQRIDKANAIDVIGYQKNKLKGLVLRNIRLLYRPMLPYHWINLEDVEDVEIENIICESYMENI